MGNVLTAIMSYRLYDNWTKNTIFEYKKVPKDDEYDGILKECFLSEKDENKNI